MTYQGMKAHAVAGNSRQSLLSFLAAYTMPSSRIVFLHCPSISLERYRPRCTLHVELDAQLHAGVAP